VRWGSHILLAGLLVLNLLLAASLPAQNPQATPPPEKPQTSGATPPEESEAPQAADSANPQIPLRERADAILREGLKDENMERRAKAVAALGLLRGDRQARREAVKALQDEKSAVRAAAAAALGAMHAVAARRELEAVLDDPDPSVVLAAANSLLEMKDHAAYDVYYGVLTGEQKTGKGFVRQELAMLHDKKKMAQLGIDEGIGFVPFAGIPYSVLKMVLKNDSSGVRAAAARALASDPDPSSRDALIDALADKSTIVRQAALEALAHRRDSSLLSKVAPSLDDNKDEVRFFAAACVLQLSRLKTAHGSPPAGAKETSASAKGLD
jgi:HEAT repeat protein